MEEKNLTLEQENVIKEKAKKLKTEGKYRKVFPMVVFGDTESGEKEFYVAYMREPNFPTFSKFMAASKKDEVQAMRTLAKDCFLDGDKEAMHVQISQHLLKCWYFIAFLMNRFLCKHHAALCQICTENLKRAMRIA